MKLIKNIYSMTNIVLYIVILNSMNIYLMNIVVWLILCYILLYLMTDIVRVIYRYIEFDEYLFND